MDIQSYILTFNEFDKQADILYKNQKELHKRQKKRIELILKESVKFDKEILNSLFDIINEMKRDAEFLILESHKILKGFDKILLIVENYKEKETIEFIKDRFEKNARRYNEDTLDFIDEYQDMIMEYELLGKSQ